MYRLPYPLSLVPFVRDKQVIRGFSTKKPLYLPLLMSASFHHDDRLLQERMDLRLTPIGLEERAFINKRFVTTFPRSFSSFGGGVVDLLLTKLLALRYTCEITKLGSISQPRLTFLVRISTRGSVICNCEPRGHRLAGDCMRFRPRPSEIMYGQKYRKP
jgi:hypothetical protein